jgi:hypothetical protein
MSKRLISLILILSCHLWPQTPTGEIAGTVSDASGAVIAGAKVTVTNPATNVQRLAESNELGLYSVPALPPGVYNVRVEKAGFSVQSRTNLELQTGQVAKIDISMQIGNVAETVEVTAAPPVIESETTSIGTVIENRRIVELPLNGRNYLQLASLIPGATTNGPASSQGQQRMGGARNSFALNVAGQRVHFNHYSLDGMENTDPNFNTYLFLPSIDALQEFKVESGLFPAEYGRAIAQVNATTKSGTNEFHGTAFEFLRNAKLDAKNYFDRKDLPKPAFKRNQFGGTVTGRILRDKLFFMGNYEGLRERRALTQTGTLPTAALRSGNIGRAIVDPFSTGRVPFPNNVIPASRIQATSAKVLNDFFPLPNNTGATGLANNYINNEGRDSDGNQGSGRLDWSQSSNSNFFFRFSQTVEPQYIPSVINGQGNLASIYAQQGVLGHTKVFGATKVNELKFGVNYFKSSNSQTRAGVRNVVEELGIPDIDRTNALFWGIPVFQISGFSNVGECNDCPFVNWNTTGMLTDNFSWNKGKHQIKIGGEVRRVRYNQIGAVVPRGRFSFSGQYSGDPMADFLLGTMSNTEGQVGAPIANMRSNYLALYIQDTWKLSPKLTINLGLRWEYESPWYDKHDAIVNIDFRWDNSIEPVYVRAGTGDPFEGNPQFPLPADVKYTRDGRFGRGAFAPDRNDIAPRFGIAYSLDSKTVIRTGGGIYYVRDIGNATFDVVRNAPFTIRRNEPGNQTVPNLSWQVPFTQKGAPTFILINQFGERTSYIGQWSFGVQRELTKDMSLEVTYMGSTGVHLRRLQTYNAPPPGAGNQTARRPFPKFGGFQVMNAPGHSSYHALQSRLQHRFSNGFTLLGSYAWSKSIDNGSGVRTTDGDPLTPMDDYNLGRERGRSAFDFRHRFTASFLYELPFGKGRAMAIDNPVANFVLGGWQVGGIFTVQTGFPLTAFCGPGNIQNGGNYCAPDVVPGQSPNDISERTVQRFFNTAAFVDRLGQNPAAITDFRYGNSGRNTITGPGITSLDASLTKLFRISERQRLEFRTEFFNLPNHPIFAPPGTTLRTVNYGVIGATRVDSRQLQFALKYQF